MIQNLATQDQINAINDLLTLKDVGLSKTTSSAITFNTWSAVKVGKIMFVNFALTINSAISAYTGIGTFSGMCGFDTTISIHEWGSAGMTNVGMMDVTVAANSNTIKIRANKTGSYIGQIIIPVK